MHIAFYKASGNIYDWLIRIWTGPYLLQPARYSHCELVFSDGVCISASPRDGGVRAKHIDLVPDSWDLVDIPTTSEEEAFIRLWAESFLGRPYDWIGIFFSEFLHLGIQSPQAEYCSEFCGRALAQAGKLPAYRRRYLSPQALYDLLTS